MTEKRKLQGEMDRTLKKVSEGVEDFIIVWEKFNATPNSNQRDKYDADMRKEIKKLQRYRDTIKMWMATSEWKDKKELLDAKKQIELQMDRFKLFEKDAKLKAAVKDGIFAANVDPMAKPRADTAKWINRAIGQLIMERSEYTDELDHLDVKKKKKEDEKHRMSLLDEIITTHSYHIEKLEFILAKIEEKRLSPIVVNGIQDEINYYIESCMDPDFVADEFIYSELKLEELQKNELKHLVVDNVDDLSIGDDFKGIDDDNRNIHSSISQLEEVSINVPNKNFSSSSSSSSISANNYNNISSSSSLSSSIGGNSAIINREQVSSKVSTPKPLIKSKPGSVTLPRSITPVPMNSPSSKLNIIKPISSSTPQPASTERRNYSQVAAVNVSPKPTAPSIKQIRQLPNGQLANLQKQPLVNNTTNSQVSTSPQLLNSSSKDTGTEINDDNNKLMNNELITTLRLLKNGHINVPNALDSDRTKVYLPRNPINVPPFFPSIPLPFLTEQAAFYSNYDVDTLFFVFYYLPGTYQQYLASRELKRQSWRFHKKYLTWFQRHNEPQLITEEFEKGVYIYFDFENSWCQRKKLDFTFEYKYLEDQ